MLLRVEQSDYSKFFDEIIDLFSQIFKNLMNFENQYLLSTQYRDILEALMGMDYILRIAYEVTGSIDHISTFVK